jgi:hypothetical protein
MKTQWRKEMLGKYGEAKTVLIVCEENPGEVLLV